MNWIILVFIAFAIFISYIIYIGFIIKKPESRVILTESGISIDVRKMSKKYIDFVFSKEKRDLIKDDKLSILYLKILNNSDSEFNLSRKDISSIVDFDFSYIMGRKRARRYMFLLNTIKIYAGNLITIKPGNKTGMMIAIKSDYDLVIKLHGAEKLLEFKILFH